MSYGEKDIVKITSIGSLSLIFHLTLTESQLYEYDININEIDSFEGIKDLFFNEDEKGSKYNNESATDLTDLVSLSSNNNLINSLLYINRASERKAFIEHIALCELVYSKENYFIKEFIKKIAGKNALFIIDNPLMSIVPEVKLIINILEDDAKNTIQSKTINLVERITKADNGLLDNENIYNYLKYKFNCNYLYSDFSELLHLKNKEYKDIVEFYSSILIKYPKVKIITNFNSGILSSISMIDTIKNIVDLSDIIIFEKDELNKFYSNYNGNNGIKWNKMKPGLISDRDKKRKSIPRISIIIDKLTNIALINQQGVHMDVEYYKVIRTNFLNKKVYSNEKEKDEYQQIISDNYLTFKSFFIGGFLSRLIYDKPLKICFSAGNLLVKKMLDVMRFNINDITDLSFYQVKVPKKKVNLKEINLLINKEIEKQKENNFQLDCINYSKSKNKTEYNPLYDRACDNFFRSKNTRDILKKQGLMSQRKRFITEGAFNNVSKKNDRFNYGLKEINATFLTEKNVRGRNKILTTLQTFQNDIMFRKIYNDSTSYSMYRNTSRKQKMPKIINNRSKGKEKDTSKNESKMNLTHLLNKFENKAIGEINKLGYTNVSDNEI